MGRCSKKPKIAKDTHPPKSKNEPRTDANIHPPKSKNEPREEPHQENPYPAWQFRAMDMEGDWGWEGQEINFLEIRIKLANFESMKWLEIEGPKSHFVKFSSLSKKAQKRLKKLKYDDIDELFSLRLSGKERLWGIREGSIFKILWWDPTHEVCLSIKKHT